VTPDQYAARAEALEMLFNLADKYGPLSQSKEAHAFYNDWYCAQMIDPQEDPKLASYYVRKVKLHVPKLASLMAIGDGRFQVEKIDYVRALHLLHKTEKKLKMVHLLTGGNKYVHHMSRIQHILEANGGKVPMRDLMRMFFQDLTMEEFKAIITQLDFMDIATKREIDGVLYLVAQ
jgi:hypothetical protein